jgi:hypothetical protein
MVQGSFVFEFRMTLYHGTNERFQVFDPNKVRTARHLYLTDEFEIAETYGKRVYRVLADGGKHANLHPEDSGPEDMELLKSVYADIGEDFGYENFESFFVDITGAEGNLYGVSGRFQDALFSEIFSRGYHSISFPDPALDRSWGISFVFDDPNRLQIVEELPYCPR